MTKGTPATEIVKANKQWSVAEAAKELGIKPKTLTGYLARGQMPKPDGRVGRSPWWYPDTIKGWRA